MKILKNIFVLFSILFALQLMLPTTSNAQCAMCSMNAENSTQHGNTQGKGLNNGILFLLGMPFIIGAAVGVLWYTKFRKKEEKPSVL